MTAPQVVRHDRQRAAAAALAAQMAASRQELRRALIVVAVLLWWPVRWLWQVLVELAEPAAVGDRQLADVRRQIDARWARTSELAALVAEGRDAQ